MPHSVPPIAHVGHLTPSAFDQPTLFDFGSSGGINWGGVSIDVDHGIMVVTWMRTGHRVTVVTREDAVRRKFKLNPGTTPGGDAQRLILGRGR